MGSSERPSSPPSNERREGRDEGKVACSRDSLTSKSSSATARAGAGIVAGATDADVASDEDAHEAASVGNTTTTTPMTTLTATTATATALISGRKDQTSKTRRRARDKELLESVSSNSTTCLTDYNVFGAVGKGKFSTVFRAERKSSGQMCALKRVSVFLNMSRKTRIKCLEEVDLIRALDHVNIIQCLDAFIDKDELIIVLEWASAGDLKRQIRKAREKNKGFQERIIWRYFTQLASAIEHMHAKRIMHRDLKPANVFLMTDGSVKVGDLGLGRALSDTTLTAHSKVGTPLYMSPEVLRGKGYDWKSDVWSLGCILYELAALRSPFKEEGIALPELFRKILNGSYPALNLEGHYSEELGTLVDAMLLVNSERRPDMAEICLRAEAIQTSLDMRPPTIATQRTALKPSPVHAVPGAVGEREKDISQARSESSRLQPSGSSGSAKRQQQHEHKHLSKRHEHGRKKTERVADDDTAVRPALSGCALLEIDKAADFLALAAYDGRDLHPAFRFAHDPSMIGGGDGERHAQFASCMKLCSWMLRRMKSNWIYEAMTPPLNVSRSLLAVMSRLGPSIQDQVAGISPAQLVHGFGLGVCRVVRVLAEALVVRVQKVQLRMPDYASVRSDAISLEVDEKHLDDTSSIAEFEHSEGEEEEEEEEYGDDGDRLFGKDDSSLQRHARATSGAIGAPILLPKLDNPSQDSAKAWELEKEKVGLRLQHVSQMCHAQLKGTWRGRQEILSVHKAKLGQECSRAVERLEGAAAVWAQDLEHIRHGETRIARAFELERDTQSALNAHARTIQSRTDALRLVVNELAERMAELEDQRDKLDVEIQRRSEALSDASSTKNFRAALARLREEVNAMNTKIGIQLQKIEARQQVVLREVKVLHFAQERDEHRSMYHSM